jgi:Uma2 family endonuclease
LRVLGFACARARVTQSECVDRRGAPIAATGHTSAVTSSAHPVFYGYDEYLAHEEACNTKNEYLEGQIYAMAGASPEHNRLASAASGLLLPQLLSGRCRAYSSDQRVRVKATGLATYPDVTVICGPIELDDEDPRRHTALNPTLLIEVLSPSTEAYDRGEKFEHYKRIPTLEQYVLIPQEERRIDVWTRRGDDWILRSYETGAKAELAAIGAALEVSTLYEAAAEPD